ncbi:MAG: hypothetical protein HUU50_01775 [Candidatus Brocadiae bacterium]|nr:hypothetical protein [Candidatus Brocadiia bacterium]
MHTFIFILFLFFCWGINADSRVIWEYMTSKKPAPVNVKIEKNAHQLFFHVNWPGFFKKWISSKNAYEIFTPGAGQNYAEQEACVPFLSYLIAVPEGSLPEIRIDYVATVMFGEIPIVINAKNPKDSAFLQEKNYDFREETNNRKSFTNGPVKVCLQKIGKSHGLDMVYLSIMPFEVLQQEAQINIGEIFTLELNLSHGTWEMPVPVHSRPFSFGAMLNIANSVQQVREEEEKEEYLIISPSQFLNALEPLVSWRTQEGFLVTVKTIDQVKKELQFTGLLSADKLQEYLSLYYNTQPALTYVLLVGDVEMIPVKYKNDDATDFHYSLLDGEGDMLPDVYLGRFPVNTEEEVAAIVEKIIAYEQSLPGKKILLASYFQDDGLDGICDRDYIYTCESFASYLSKRQYDIKRVYTKTPGSTPCYYGNNTPVPKSLNFEGTTQEIIHAINSGLALINHRDHGDSQGWNHPSFRVEDLQQLCNKKYPIMFNVDCTTGQFDIETEKFRRETEGTPLSTQGESFSEQILSMRGRGVVAIIAPTRETIHSLNDVFNKGLMESIWPKMFDAPYSSATRLGQILYRARIKVLREFGDNGWVSEKILTNFRQYHILGDPALRIRQAQ